MNVVVISGNMCADPEIRVTESGKKVVKFSIGVYRNKEKTDFIKCLAWEKSAEIINDNGYKGAKVVVQGSWQTGSYEKDGKKVYTNECNVNRAEFPKKLSTPTEPQAPTETTAEHIAQTFDGQDVPF